MIVPERAVLFAHVRTEGERGEGGKHHAQYIYSKEKLKQEHVVCLHTSTFITVLPLTSMHMFLIVIQLFPLLCDPQLVVANLQSHSLLLSPVVVCATSYSSGWL